VQSSKVSQRFRDHDALLIVDVQRDFLPGGALAVPAGDAVVPVLNRYISLAARSGVPVYASRDWHPHGHVSFHARGGPWPVHCVAESDGAAFAPELVLPPGATVISKATTAEEDAYSAFAGTDLAATLRARGVTRLWVGGLATDYCVLNTVLDARREGFAVLLLEDAIRPVDVAPGDGARAITRMREAGATPVSLADVVR
jgi:nicotinamidase/pyrazinamidase